MSFGSMANRLGALNTSAPEFFFNRGAVDEQFVFEVWLGSPLVRRVIVHAWMTMAVSRVLFIGRPRRFESGVVTGSMKLVFAGRS
jgi:hypothetical protein